MLVESEEVEIKVEATENHMVWVRSPVHETVFKVLNC